ncbi:MAG: hypothetical protein JWL61_2983 [Gemmatimonadetes bacterium]|jgi:hypothetical protein|nr:hypothetical protein [Gemmatimonadota bacterium]
MKFVRAVMGMRWFATVTPTLLLAFALHSSAAYAQTNVQLLLGGAAAFNAPTAADLSAGTLEGSTPLAFQVVTTGEPSGSLSTSVYIRSSASTLGGGKSVADLEWRRDDDPTWRALTTSDVLVESRSLAGVPEGHSWDNTIQFRMALRWTGDPPATYRGSLVLTVSASR